MSAQKVCPRCQTPAPMLAAQCANCGRVYRTTAPQAPTPDPTRQVNLSAGPTQHWPPPRNNRRAGLAVLAVLAGVLLTGVAFMAANRSRSAAPPAGPTRLPPPPIGGSASGPGLSPLLEPLPGQSAYRYKPTGETVILPLGPTPEALAVLAKLSPGPAPCGDAWGMYTMDLFRSTRRCVRGHRFEKKQGTWVPRED